MRVCVRVCACPSVGLAVGACARKAATTFLAGFLVAGAAAAAATNGELKAREKAHTPNEFWFMRAGFLAALASVAASGPTNTH